MIERLNEKVRHGINGTFHAITALHFGITVHWAIGFLILFIARLIFTTALNLMRFGAYGFYYVSPDPKSIVDKAEILAFGQNAVIPKLIYAFVITTLNLLLFKQII